MRIYEFDLLDRKVKVGTFDVAAFSLSQAKARMGAYLILTGTNNLDYRCVRSYK